MLSEPSTVPSTQAVNEVKPMQMSGMSGSFVNEMYLFTQNYYSWQ